MSIYKVLGSAVTGTISDNNIGSASTIRVVATAGTNTITVKNSGGSTIGTIYLHAAGDSIDIRKDQTDTCLLYTSPSPRDRG